MSQVGELHAPCVVAIWPNSCESRCNVLGWADARIRPTRSPGQGPSSARCIDARGQEAVAGSGIDASVRSSVGQRRRVGPHDAKAQRRAACLHRVGETIGRSAFVPAVVPGSTADDAARVGIGALPGPPVGRCSDVVRVPRVLDPLGHVAVQVEESKGACNTQRADGRRLAASVALLRVAPWS